MLFVRVLLDFYDMYIESFYVVEVHRRKTRKRAHLPEKEAAKKENKIKIAKKMLLHKYNLQLKKQGYWNKNEIKRGIR